MATYGEMTYAVLDLLKEHSDDAFYTEEHVLFFLKKMRALLLERKYKNSRNATFSPMSEENRQQICMKITNANISTISGEGVWMMSVDTIPDLLPINQAVACTGHDLLSTMVSFIPFERMQNVGYNKWLRNIIYASKSHDGHLYLRGMNKELVYLEMVGLTGVFTDPEQAEYLAHDVVMGTPITDINDRRFPLENALQAQCIEMVVQELIGQRYAPEDKKNDAKDSLSEAAVATKQAPDVARQTARTNEEEEQ